MTCRTDGGPQFRGPFKEYCDRKGILHELSSPYNPRSNGHAEAAVKAAKHLVIKTTPSTFQEALAAWRNTARQDKPCPNEMFFHRKIRDEKPITNTNLHPETNSSKITNDSAKSNNATQKQFQPGDRVRVQDPGTKRWNVKAKVDHVSETGRTLQMTSSDGVNLKRNRRFVRATCAALQE